MKNLTLFSHPWKTYKWLDEAEVAKRYTDMALHQFDKFVQSHENYAPFIDKPDAIIKALKKQNRQILLTLFANQPLIKVWDTIGEFISSSYLFNPSTNHEELILPDLDVVELGWNKLALKAIKEIRDFYESFWWTTGISENQLPRFDTLKTDRFLDGTNILNRSTIINEARRLINWDITKLYF